jgi:hypothetical protein
LNGLVLIGSELIAEYAEVEELISITGIWEKDVHVRIYSQLPIGNRMEFLLQVSISTLGYVPIAFLLLGPPEDRGLAKMKLRSLMVKA